MAAVRYSADAAKFSRELFTSNPDDVIAVRMSSSQPGRLSFKLSLGSGDLPGEVVIRHGNTLVLMGSSWESKHSDGRIGVDFEAWVRVLARGGQVSSGKSSIEIRNADSVTLTSSLGGKRKVRYRDLVVGIDVKPGSSVHLDSNLKLTNA